MTQLNSTLTPEFLTDDAPPVLFFGGKGGVGKTTTAAATAIVLARLFPDDSIMLVSTDPAHSVADALADAALPANLIVEEIDAAAEHTAFMDQHRDALHMIASRGTFLDDDEIRTFLDLSLPGVDELMSFVRLASWFNDEAADRYVVDTAPTGHALRLLSMPDMLKGWLAAVEALMGKHRYMASVFGGDGAEDPVETFLEEITDSFDNIAAVLSDGQYARFVPVFNAEPMSIAETERLLDDLDSLEIDAPELVLNRLAPAAAAGPLASLRNRQIEAIGALPTSMSERRIVAVPLLAHEPRGGSLSDHFTHALSLDDWTQSAIAAVDTGPSTPSIKGQIELTGQKLTLVGGKGGVGKTTMSCAAATTIAARGAKTLLVSTDPAGSLGDALGLSIGSSPTAIADRLDAIQLDAERELEALKTEYADELEGFLDGFAMDLSFDREALEQLLELAPTGIDEVMALVRMTELLDEGGYDSIVVDTAPTGHTLRLLELPALVQAWLEQIFAVLIHYSNIISLPRLNDRLLRLSKGLKHLRALLESPDSTSMVLVAIPTNLAAAETERLLAGLSKLGVPAAGVIVNQATPQSDDALAASLREREQAAIERIRGAAGELALAEVERGGDLRGPEQLALLGTGLFSATAAGTSMREAA